MVTPADIVGKRDLFFGVNIPAKTTFLVTGGATVTASDPFIGLENELDILNKLTPYGLFKLTPIDNL